MLRHQMRSSHHGSADHRRAGLRARPRPTDPLHAAHPRVLHRHRLHHAVPLGAPQRRPLSSTKLAKPLAQSRIAIITTAAPYQPDKGDQGPGAAYNGSAKFYQVYDGDTAIDHDLRISHIGYDRKYTTATDPGTWFPLAALRRAAAAGRIGPIAPRFFGAPTNRSHRVTLDTDAPEIVRRALADGVDAAIVVPTARSATRPPPSPPARAKPPASPLW